MVGFRIHDCSCPEYLSGEREIWQISLKNKLTCSGFLEKLHCLKKGRRRRTSLSLTVSSVLLLV